MTNSFENLVLMSNIFFMSFLDIGKDDCKVSYFWLIVNSLKFVLWSFGIVIGLIEVAETIPSMKLQVFTVIILENGFVALIWIYLIVNRNEVIETYKAMKNLAEKIDLLNFPDICLKSKQKLSAVFAVYQFYLIYVFVHTVIIDNTSWKFMFFLYSKILANNFMIAFCVVTEFLLVCVKLLRKSFFEVVKRERVVLLNFSANHEKTKAFDQIRNATDITVFFHHKIFLLALKIGKLFNLIILFSLLLRLVTDTVEVEEFV